MKNFVACLSGTGAVDLRSENWVNLLYGGAELAETAANKLNFRSILSEPEGDRADRFDLKNRIIWRDNVVLEALVVGLQLEKFRTAAELGIKGDSKLAVWSHESLAIVTELNGRFELTPLDKIKEFRNNHALGARPVAPRLAENLVIPLRKFNRLGNWEKKAPLCPKPEVLVLDLDKSGRGNLATLGAINPNANLPAAVETTLLLPIALAVRSFEILGDDWVTPISRSQTVHDKAIIKVAFKLITIFERDQILVFCAIETHYLWRIRVFVTELLQSIICGHSTNQKKRESRFWRKISIF